MIHEAVEKALKEYQEATVDEGFGQDRQSLVGQVQALGKRIANRASFSSIPDGSMAVMVSNLQAIANKLN